MMRIWIDDDDGDCNDIFERNIIIAISGTRPSHEAESKEDALCLQVRSQKT